VRLNYVGLIGGVVALISLVLPWWTMAITWTISVGEYRVTASEEVVVYLYKAILGSPSLSISADINLWFGALVIALMLAAGILGIVGSLFRMRSITFMASGGALALLSAVFFAFNMYMELQRPTTLVGGVPRVGLFSIGTFGLANTHIYIAYLSFGFWLALATGFMMLIATIWPHQYSSVSERTPAEGAPLSLRSQRQPATPHNYCTACGAALNEEAVFCSKCGKAVKQTQPMFYRRCMTCGAGLEEDEVFCKKCGTVVRTPGG